MNSLEEDETSSSVLEFALVLSLSQAVKLNAPHTVAKARTLIKLNLIFTSNFYPLTKFCNRRCEISKVPQVILHDGENNVVIQNVILMYSDVSEAHSLSQVISI